MAKSNPKNKKSPSLLAAPTGYHAANIRSDPDQIITSELPLMLMTPEYDQGQIREIAHILIGPSDASTPARFWVEQEGGTRYSIIRLEAGYAYVSTATVTSPLPLPSGPVKGQSLIWARPRVKTGRTLTAGNGTRFCVQVRPNDDRIFFRAGNGVQINALVGQLDSFELKNTNNYNIVSDTGEIPNNPPMLQGDATSFIVMVETVAKAAGMQGIP